MTGSSQAAIAQQTAALHRPPHLVCIWPDVGPVNSYQHFARRGGALALQVFGSLVRHAHDLPAVVETPGTQDAIGDALVHMKQWLGLMPFRPGDTPLAHVPDLESVFFDYYYRGCYDDFWAQEGCDQSRHWERHADIPGMFSGGWFDPFVGGTIGYFGARRASSSRVQKLLIGPWAHETMRTGSSAVGDADFGRDAAWGTARYHKDLLAFFGRYLRGEPAWDAVPTARTFVMGGGSGTRTTGGLVDHGGRWRAGESWPPQGVSSRAYYLWVDGSMRPSVPPDADDFAPLRFDPSKPVPTLGGAFQGLYRFPRSWKADGRHVKSVHLGRNLTPPGPRDQRVRTKRTGSLGHGLPIAARADVLVFQTEPLAQDTEVTGEAVVELWVSSSAPDTDFTAKIVDAYPPSRDFPSGLDLAISGTIFRARYREGWDHEVLMRPDQRYLLRLNFPPISNLFAAGHRVRLYISNSDHPQFEVNPNTGEAPGRNVTTCAALNRVHMSRDAASRILLPVM